MNSEKVTDVLAAAGYATSSVGLGIGTWFAHNWLAILSGVGIVLAIFFQWRQDKRQTRRMELLENDEND